MARTARISAQVDTRELRRDLNALEDGLGRELDAVLLGAATLIAQAAKPLTPFDPEHRSDRADHLPHLRDTIAPRVTAGGAQVIADHPAGPVWEFGGNIAPSGVPITIPQKAMAHKAFEAVAPVIERELEQNLGELIRRHNL